MIDVFAQPAQAAIALYGGLAFGLLLALICLLRKLPIGRAGRLVTDMLIPLALFASLGLSMLLATGGVPRAYALLFFALGAAVARISFVRLVKNFIQIIRK